MDNKTVQKNNTHTSFYEWFDNFWYHYKWQVIGIAFAIFVFLVCTLQACEKEQNDVYVVYGGPETFIFDSGKTENIKAALASVLPGDLNGDGKKQIGLITNFIMSEKEIEKLSNESALNGETDFYVDASVISSNLKNFDSLILTGEYSICLVSPYLYERVKNAGGLMPLSEIFDYTPDGAVDEYGIILAETEFGQYFAGVRELSPDTVLCIRSSVSISSFFRKNKAEKVHAQALELFKAIVEFKSPETT